jgi:hypothetical protein
MQLLKAVENKMFAHFLATFQWALLVLVLALNLNSSVVITGATAHGGLKIITVLHLWMLLVPTILCLVFYRTRKNGMAKKGTIGLSLMTIVFSFAALALHFTNEMALLMKAIEIAAWSSYHGVFFVSLYKILAEFLMPLLSRSAGTIQESVRYDGKLRAQD